MQEGTEYARSPGSLSPPMNLDKRLFRQLAHVRGFFALAVLSGATAGLLIVLQAIALSHIIARVFVDGARLDGVWEWMLALLAILPARAIIGWAGEWSAFQMAARVKQRLREAVFGHLTALGPSYVRGERTGELINTLTEGIEALEPFFSQYLPQLVLAVLVPLLILGFVFPLDPLSGIVLLVTAPLIPLFMVLIGNAADALTRRQFKSLSLLSAHLLDVLQGLATLKMLGRSREQAQRIGEVSHAYRDRTMRVLRVAFLSALTLEMIATISTAIVAVQVGLRLLYGYMAFEQAFFVLVLAPDFYQPLRLLGARFHAGISAVAPAQRIFEILEIPVSELRGTPMGIRFQAPRHDQGDKGVLTPECHFEGEIPHGIRKDGPAGFREGPRLVVDENSRSRASIGFSFHDVCFAYDGNRAALERVTFVLTPGQKLALVGPTGAGKSTIAQLLLRFIEPDQGEICSEGIPIHQWTREEWRARIAWVPQHPYLFDDTVTANIRMGRPEATVAEVHGAALLACTDEFIRGLPEGYDTRIGERGARLSGGQAQRIALARAFLKDAPLLIVDEGTSNLDVENESQIRTAMTKLLEKRSALIITHRLNTVVAADQVLVLAQGRVVEQGRHMELMDRRGLYYRFVTGGEES